MNYRDFMGRMSGHFHHHAIVTLNDGTTKEGYAQPPSEEFCYLTALDGSSAGKVALTDIKNIEFPDG